MLKYLPTIDDTCSAVFLRNRFFGPVPWSGVINKPRAALNQKLDPHSLQGPGMCAEYF